MRLYLYTALLGVTSAGAVVYVPVYLVRIDAQPFEVALLTSLPALLMLLFAFPVASWVERQPDLIGTVVRASFVYFFLRPLVIALLLLTPLGRQPLIITAAWALFSMAFAAFLPAWMAAMPYIIPRGRMISATGDRWAIQGVVFSVAVAGFGALVDYLPFPLNYQVVFVLSSLAGLLALCLYKGIRSPRRSMSQSPAQRTAGQLRLMGQAITRHHGFSRFLLGVFVYQVARWLPEGLYPVFWVRDLGASEGWIGIRTMVAGVALMLGCFVWGRVTGRLGRGRVLVLCTAAMGLYPALTALAPAAVWLVLIAVLGGFFFNGIDVVLFEAWLAKSPVNHRPTFVAAGNMLDDLARLLAPPLGAWLSGLWNIRAALFIGSGIYFVAAMLFRGLTFEAIPNDPDELVEQASCVCTS